MKKSRILFSLLYLFYPAISIFLMGADLPHPMGLILIYCIMILGIILFFACEPCNFGFLLGGAILMPFTIIPYGIIGNIMKYGIENAFIEIEWAPLIVLIYCGFYTLPYVIISSIAYSIKNKKKDSSD
ncbi:MAG: hypothetical protein FWD48_05435 [Oscillospiraceae bacterium]|nr:hypothetical protein [Oscillospiraceae bacterium]